MTLRKFVFFTSICFLAIASVLGGIQIMARLACENSPPPTACVNPFPFPEIFAIFGFVFLVFSFFPQKSRNNSIWQPNFDSEKNLNRTTEDFVQAHRA